MNSPVFGQITVNPGQTVIIKKLDGEIKVTASEDSKTPAIIQIGPEWAYGGVCTLVSGEES